MQALKKILKNNKGFSLIEVMAAVVMMVVLMSVVIPNVMGMNAKGRLDADIISASAIGKAVELYAIENEDMDGDTDEIIKAIESEGYVKGVGVPKSRGYSWQIDVDDNGRVKVEISKGGEEKLLYPNIEGEDDKDNAVEQN